MTHSQALKAAELAGRASADQAGAVNPYNVNRDPAYAQAWIVGRRESLAAFRAATARTVADGNRWATVYN